MQRRSKAGRSAYGAAAIRAMESFVPQRERLFEDGIVLDLLPPSVRFLLERRLFRALLGKFTEATAPGIRGALLCRTRRIDDAVRDAVRRGLRRVVILGAGLDTRACRLLELQRASLLEIDLAALQEYKKARLLRRFGVLPSNVHFVPIDLNTERLETALDRGGLNGSEPALFIWEGVTQYLRRSAVDSVLRAIAKQPQGTELIFTYVLEEAITGVFREGRSEAFRKSARRKPEPWYFGVDPSQIEAFLAERGLNLRHDFGAAEHIADYLRPIGRKLDVSEIERVAIAAVGDGSGTAA